MTTPYARAIEFFEQGQSQANDEAMRSLLAGLSQLANAIELDLKTLRERQSPLAGGTGRAK